MSPSSGNTRIGESLSGRRLELHRAGASDALAWLGRRPVSTATTALVLALVLSMPLLLAMGLRNLEGIGSGLEAARDINAYLVPGLDGEAVEAARVQVAALAGVDAVDLRTPDEGLSRLSELPGVSEVLAGLDSNPLPHVLIVRAAPALDDVALDALAGSVEAVAGVDLVHHDRAWRDRFDALLALMRQLIAVLAILTGAGAVLVIGWTVWVEVARRREEIAIVQMLGGSRAYIRRPFLYTGALLGLLAAAIAALIVGVGWLALKESVATLAASYDSEFRLRGPGLQALGLTMLAGPMLGWFGAFAATTRELVRGDRR
jgi:cell division transport system permease protein